MSETLISIIIPCYNMGGLLLETIQSVEDIYNPQIHEVIIIDDGSTDDETVKIISDINTHQVVRQKNGGLANARNTGITLSKGDFLLFLDSDNLLTNGYLTKGVEVMQKHPEIDVVYGVSEKFGDETGKLDTKPYNLQTLMSYNYIDACCLVRKSLINEIGGFDENLKVPGLADWELWLRASFHGKAFYYLDDVVVQKYRVRADSMIRNVNRSKAERDIAYDYLSEKFPSFINTEAISNFYFKKFNEHTFGWTAKLFIKKYFPSLFGKLVARGKFSKYL